MKPATALSISVGCFATAAGFASYRTFLAPSLGGTVDLGVPLVLACVGGIFLAQAVRGRLA